MINISRRQAGRSAACSRRARPSGRHEVIELLVDASTTWPEPSIDDYAERTASTIEGWKSIHGQQPGDPAKLAQALLTIANQEPPLRFVAGADAIEAAEAKAKELLAQAEASRELGGNLAYDNTEA
jgi:hypothetical protein